MSSLASKDKAQYEILRKTFQAMDVNHDFAISKEELLNSVQNEDVAVSMMRSMDVNNDGKIDFKEFVAGFEKAQQLTGSVEEETRTAEEIKVIRAQCKDENERKLQEIFSFCDVDGSGLISFQETCMAMKYFLNRSINAQEKIKIQSFFKVSGEQLSFEKFKSFIVPWLLSFGVMIKAPPEPLNKQIFSFVDADGSGQVSADEALMALKFLGKQITDDDKVAINSLSVFANGGEVNFDDFETKVLPVLMHTDARRDTKMAQTVIESGEAILLDASLSADEKVKKMAELHEKAKNSDWLEKCGAYEKVDADATSLRTDFVEDK